MHHSQSGYLAPVPQAEPLTWHCPRCSLSPQRPRWHGHQRSSLSNPAGCGSQTWSWSSWPRRGCRGCHWWWRSGGCSGCGGTASRVLLPTVLPCSSCTWQPEGPQKRFLSEDVVSGVTISPECMSQPWTEEAEGYLAVSLHTTGMAPHRTSSPSAERAPLSWRLSSTPLRIASDHWEGLTLCQGHCPP